MPFDLLLRGGLLIDGTGSPARPADVAISGDRVVALGDLGAVVDDDVATVIDATGHVVAPGFVDPHGHSDGSVFLDGALVSHLRQGFTTQLSGNCGYTFAPLTPLARDMLAADLAALGLDPSWTTFAGFLDAVEAQPLGPNVAFLVGHGTVRSAVLGPDSRHPSEAELAAMVAYVDEALEAGAVGVSSGLIYAPGMHARPDEVAALVAAATRRDALYATHMRNEAGGVLGAIDEAVSTARAAGEQAGGRRALAGVAPQGGRTIDVGDGGRAGRSHRGGPARRPRRRRRPVPVCRGGDDPRDASCRPRSSRSRRTRSWPPSGTRPPARGSATTRPEG